MTARSEAAFDRIVSYHEAGHAVAHIRLNIQIQESVAVPPQNRTRLRKRLPHTVFQVSLSTFASLWRCCSWSMA